MAEKDQDMTEEFITVPKGTTVNKEKYERAVQAKEAAETRLADLEKQIAELTAKGNDAQTALDEFKAKAEADSKAFADAQEKWQKELAQKDMVAELLKADCIDPESGIASLKENETIDQLKERKPHLFKQPTKQSSLTPRDAKTSPDEALRDELRGVLGLS